MWLLFPCIFPNFSQHKMQHHPPATVTAAQHISGASLNFPRSSSTTAKLFTATSVSRCSGPSCRSRASRTRRRSCSASAKAPRASSTRASLGRGAPRRKVSHGSVERGHFFSLFVASWHMFGSKPVVRKRDSGIQIVLISLEQLLQAIYTLWMLYLMLFDACCKYCCLLQSTALRLCRISGCKSLVTRQYSS